MKPSKKALEKPALEVTPPTAAEVVRGPLMPARADADPANTAKFAGDGRPFSKPPTPKKRENRTFRL